MKRSHKPSTRQRSLVTLIALAGLSLSIASCNAQTQDNPDTPTALASGPLELNAFSGEVPFTVRTMNTGRDGTCVQVSRFASHGIEVNWGDGAIIPNYNLIRDPDAPCPPFGEHTYTVPGTYNIEVNRWDVGHADQIIPLGKQVATVTVTGKAQHETTQLAFRGVGLSLNGLPDALVYTQRQFFIDHKPSTTIDLRLALQLPDGTVLDEGRVGPIAHDGTTRLLFPQMAGERLAVMRKILAGLESTPAIMVLQAFNQAGEVIAEERQDIALSAVLPQQTTMCPFRDREISVGEEISISMSHRMSDPLAYQMDWGDGHIEQDARPKWTRTSWRAGKDSRKLKLSHAYAKAGTYDIKLRFENKRSTSTLDEVIDTCKAQVTVT